MGYKNCLVSLKGIYFGSMVAWIFTIYVLYIISILYQLKIHECSV